MRFPVATFLVIATAAVAGFHQSALVYDRTQILAGELWRLVTSNWVHFSASHAAYDLLAFGFAGSLIELRRHRGFGWFCMIAPAVIGATVFVSRADVQLFGGLSGLATGAIVFLALHGVRERGAWRCICAAALVAVAAKLAFEFYSAQPLFFGANVVEIITVPESHMAGAVVAAAVYLIATWMRSSPFWRETEIQIPAELHTSQPKEGGGAKWENLGTAATSLITKRGLDLY